MKIEIRGLDELIKKLSPELVSKPLGDFLKRSATEVKEEGRRRTVSSWYETGETANTITYEIDRANPPLWAKVGWLDVSPGSTLWFKARAGEFGTGRQGDPAVSHTSRGGIRPRRMLRGGLESSLSAIRGFLDRLGNEIRDRWEH